MLQKSFQAHSIAPFAQGQVAAIARSGAISWSDPALRLWPARYFPTAFAVSAGHVALARTATVSANSLTNSFWNRSSSGRIVVARLIGLWAGTVPARRQSASSTY